MAKISKGELIRLQKLLKTDAAIGKKFGITRQAIHQIRKKYGVESRYAKNDERNAKVIALYKKGVSGTVIAEKVGLSVSRTYKIINPAAQKALAKKKKKGTK
jgi:DNA invertase Pin-like site-specific DNA recombinase